jgi:oligoendopeptidase F
MTTLACSGRSQSTATPGAKMPFVPADLDATTWANLQPLYQALLDRPLRCAGCLETLLLDRSDLDAAASEARANLYIRMTCHTDDEAARSAYLDFVENVEPHLKSISFALDQRIATCPHAGELDRRRYEVMLRDLQVDVELFREENIPLQTEETRLDQQYDQVCGAMTVVFRGEEKTLPQMAKFLEETDRSTREEAWRGIAERRHRDHDVISGIFDSLLKLREKMAANAGFANYRDFAFRRKHRFDYTPADCEAFHAGAEEVCVPVLRALGAERRDALRLSALRPWDLAVDVRGRAPLRPFESDSQLVERTSRLFHRMDSSLGALFDSLRGGGCLDLESRKGKAPGGYQYQRDRARTPFIFMNAAGLHRDLETMVHEAGHAFHSLLCNDEPLVRYRHSPLEFAEVASMSMELLSFPFLDEFYSPADADRARRKHLEDLAMLLPWIATIDAFQHWLYTHPDHSRAQRAAHWLTLNDRFGQAVDWAGLEAHLEIGWQRQLHLFGSPFYYIEYGIAKLGALQLWQNYRRDPAGAIAGYKKALALGGSRPLPELFAAAGLSFEFGPKTMRRLMEDVRNELSRLPA